MLIFTFSLSVIMTFAITGAITSQAGTSPAATAAEPDGAAESHAGSGGAHGRDGPGRAAVRRRARAATLDVRYAPEAFGISGVLRVTLALPGEKLAAPLHWTGSRPDRVLYRWIPVAGTGSRLLGSAVVQPGDVVMAPSEAGVYELRIEAGGVERRLDRLRLIILTPFERKQGGYLAGYHIGRYPTEGSGRTDAYAPPRGFIRVTPSNQDMRLSEHFRLDEFLTHDQDAVWPKFAVVDLQLLDKLELVLDELSSRGIPAEDMVIMSGFRTPQYNNQGLGAGRARLSRHQFGDAADVWVDGNGDWYMDDLNGDGRIDTGDARTMLRAVEDVVDRYPELVGGAGIYDDNGVHGPFIHIDARGYAARW